MGKAVVVVVGRWKASVGGSDACGDAGVHSWELPRSGMCCPRGVAKQRPATVEGVRGRWNAHSWLPADVR